MLIWVLFCSIEKTERGMLKENILLNEKIKRYLIEFIRTFKKLYLEEKRYEQAKLHRNDLEDINHEDLAAFEDVDDCKIVPNFEEIKSRLRGFCGEISGFIHRFGRRIDLFHLEEEAK